MNTNDQPLTCKRCGCQHVRWMKTNAGRWYLAFAFDTRDGDSSVRAYASVARKRPHPCGNCPRCRIDR